jgi:hypothetical protein
MRVNHLRFKGVLHMDAPVSVHFSRSLEQIKAGNYDNEYPEFRAGELIPLATDIDPDATLITWRSYDQVGMAKIIAGYSDDLPRADVYGTENTSRVRDIGDSYGYNITEIRKSARDGTQLDAKKAEAARRAHEQKQEEIAVIGATEFNLVGIANQPNTSVYVVPNGASGSPLWSDKTANEILDDLFGIGDSVVTTTKGIYRPDTICMPQVNLNIAARKRLDSALTETVLSYFQRVSPHIKNFEAWDALAGQGAGGTNRMVAYPKNPNVLQLVRPRPFEQLDEQARNLEIVVPCLSRAGGVIVFRPAAVVYADGA